MNHYLVADPWAVQGLMAGVESLCHYVQMTTQGMLDQAARIAKNGEASQ